MAFLSVEGFLLLPAGDFVGGVEVCAVGAEQELPTAPIDPELAIVGGGFPARSGPFGTPIEVHSMSSDGSGFLTAEAGSGAYLRRRVSAHCSAEQGGNTSRPLVSVAEEE